MIIEYYIERNDIIKKLGCIILYEVCGKQVSSIHALLATHILHVTLLALSFVLWRLDSVRSAKIYVAGFLNT